MNNQLKNMEENDVKILIEKKYESIENKISDKLNVKTFFWIISGIVGLIGILFGMQIDSEKDNRENTIRIITELTELKTNSQRTRQDVSELKSELKDLNKFFSQFNITVDK